MAATSSVLSALTRRNAPVSMISMIYTRLRIREQREKPSLLSDLQSSLLPDSIKGPGLLD
jgi:hypothetical protein